MENENKKSAIEYSILNNQEVLIHNGVLNKNGYLIFLEFTASDTISSMLLAVAFSGGYSIAKIHDNINIATVDYFPNGYRQETTRIDENHVRVVLFHEESLKSGGFGFTKEEANENLLNIIKSSPLPYPMDKEAKIFEDVVAKLLEEHNVSFGEPDSGFYYGLVSDWLIKLEDIILSNLDIIDTKAVNNVLQVEKTELQEVQVGKTEYVKYNFANLNKNCTIKEYEEEVATQDFYVSDCHIRKEIKLSNSKFKDFSNNLLRDTDFLIELKDDENGYYYGGDNSEVLETLAKYPHIDGEEAMESLKRFSLQEQELEKKGLIKDYHNGMKTNVILVVNEDTNEEFVVDTQGYSYARYVGLPINQVVEYAFTHNDFLDSLDEYKKIIKNRGNDDVFKIRRCVVKQTFELDDKTFNNLSSDFVISIDKYLTGVDKTITGHRYIGNNKNILKFVNDDKGQYTLHDIYKKLDPSNVDDYMKNVVIFAIKIVNKETKEEFIIGTNNTDGIVSVGLPLSILEDNAIEKIIETPPAIENIVEDVEDEDKNFEFANTDLRIVSQFVGQYQISAVNASLRSGNELQDVIKKLATQIKEVPKTYATESDENPKAMLHYFNGSSDWYIIERDMYMEQKQAYGLVRLNNNYPEYGYINIEELKSHNVELDFYFTPKSAKDLKSELECA